MLSTSRWVFLAGQFLLGSSCWVVIFAKIISFLVVNVLNDPTFFIFFSTDVVVMSILPAGELQRGGDLQVTQLASPKSQIHAAYPHRRSVACEHTHQTYGETISG